MNPRQMQQAMKKMGVQQTQIEAQEVIIRQRDKEIVISNPDVAQVNMMGQQTFQITGEYEERDRLVEGPTVTSEDVQTVVEQTGTSEDIARQAIIDANGDLAQAILSLSEDE